MNHFWQGFEKRAAEEKADKDGYKHVATVAVMDEGKILMGRRRDNNKWTNPGGHLNKGESPIQGAYRELEEETGIPKKEVKSMKHLKSEKAEGKPIIVHAYKAKIKNPQTSVQDDPDGEVHRWHWLSTDGGLKEKVLNNLHSPRNVLLKSLNIMEDPGEKEDEQEKDAFSRKRREKISRVTRSGDYLSRLRRKAKNGKEKNPPPSLIGENSPLPSSNIHKTYRRLFR